MNIYLRFIMYYDFPRSVILLLIFSNHRIAVDRVGEREQEISLNEMLEYFLFLLDIFKCSLLEPQSEQPPLLITK